MSGTEHGHTVDGTSGRERASTGRVASGVTLNRREASAWASLPRRIYLDTSTLQTVYDYGDVIWDGVPFEPIGRAASVPALADELEALRQVFLVNGRAQFEFVVTEASLREVDARRHRAYAQWVRDVLDTWLIQSAREPAPERTEMFAEPRFGNLSVKDRLLLQDALDWGCQAFLTMERRLPTASAFVERATGLRVMRPTVYWRLLAPWAALYS